jgi:hypothetical protein
VIANAFAAPAFARTGIIGAGAAFDVGFKIAFHIGQVKQKISGCQYLKYDFLAICVIRCHSSYSIQFFQATKKRGAPAAPP